MIDEKLDDLLDKRDWVVFADGTELTVDVPSKQTVLNYKFESTLDWKLTTESEWLEIDPTSGKAGKDIKIQIKVRKNKDKEGRTGYVDLTLSNDESYRITINQAGEGDENDDIIVDIPNNQIWYTSTDGEIVEPYRGENNNYADALTTFGVNIVSNTYADGKGVIEFDGDVTVIGDTAFWDCDNIKNIILPNSITTIGGISFCDCDNLEVITIPESVTTIGSANWYGGGQTFRSCDNLREFRGKFATEDGRCLIIDNVLTSFAAAGLTEYVIPHSVTTIGNHAFIDCIKLESITIPDSVTTIGYFSFGYCNSLHEFKGRFASEDGRCLIIDGVLKAFAPADVTEYIISNSVTSIDARAFQGYSLESITIPDSVTSIGYYAFCLCESLTSVTIPNSVTTIGDYAFSYCSSLTSITIPDSVTSIGEGAFAYCTSLTSVYCKAITPPAEGYGMFHNNASGRKIYVPAESYHDYLNADGWVGYAIEIIAYDYENNCVIDIEANASEETKRWLGKWSSTVSRTYCPQTGFNKETVNFEVSIAHDGVLPNAVKIYGLSVIDPTIAVDGIVNANGDLKILNFNYIGNSGEWELYVWALSEAMILKFDRHAVYTMSMDESGNVSCEVSSLEGSPYIVFDIFGYNVNTGSIGWYDTNISYYSGPMSWVKMADNGATPSRYSQKVPYITNFRPQADAKLKVVE